MFQGSGFGNTSGSPFSSSFGKPATSVFNTPMFGSTGGSSLFGSTTQPSTGLFGSTPAPAPAFGQPQTSQSTFGGFTSTNSNTGLFGAQQTQNAGTSLFGSSTTPFGANKPAFGGFGTTGQQSTGLFGQTPTAAQPTQSLFGQPAQQSTGLFGGSTAFGGGNTGTTIKFTPLTGTDTMVKNGHSQTINTRHHCITCMKEYESKSLEELRMEDYAANRKGPQQGGQGMFGAMNQQPMFGGSTSTTSTGIFGSTQDNKSPFGTTNTAFGTSGGTMFGANTAGSNLFSKPTGTPTAFGPVAGNQTSNFGFNANPSNSVFGGAQTSGGFFTNSSQPTSGFGTQTSTFPAFGTQQQTGGLFGQQNKPAFSLGTNTSQGFNFGGTATTSTAGSSFGQAKPSTFPAFPAPATTSTGFSTFGTNQNNSFFNTGNNFKGATTGFSFGQPSTGNTLGTGLNLGGGTSTMFNQNQSKPLFNTGSTNLFGVNNAFGQPATGFNSGTTGLGGSTFSIGSNNLSNSLLSGYGQNSAPAVNNALNQHMLAMASMPFGDCPLFKNILPPTTKADDALKPVSPASHLSGTNFKVSPKTESKVSIKKAPFSPHIKNSLFEGLEDEGGKNDMSFLPNGSSNKLRLNPRKLYIKPKPLSDSTRFNLSFNDSNKSLSNETILNDSSAFSPLGKGISRLIRTDMLDSTPEQTLPIERVSSASSPTSPLSTSLKLKVASTSPHTPDNFRVELNKRSDETPLRITKPSAPTIVLPISPLASSPVTVHASQSSVHGTPSSVHASPSSVHASPSSVHASPSSVHASPSSLTKSPSQAHVSPVSVPRTSLASPTSSNSTLNRTDKELGEPSSSSSGESEVEESCIPEGDPHPAGIVLRRTGYYTIPSLNELAQLVDSDGRCIVDNFTVGRFNYGNIFYPESFDVANLNLDKIVHFRHKEVVVYTDDEDKPPNGSGLNRRAQVTLDRVWPIDRVTRLPISDPDRETILEFENKLHKASARHGARFIEYRPQTGSWVFKVDHFSKYGLTDSDDEEGAAALEIKKLKTSDTASWGAIGPNKGLLSAKKMDIDPMEGAITPLAERIFREDEDEEMVEGLKGTYDLYDIDGALSPTSKLGRQLGTSAHTVQLMKASFFEPDHMESLNQGFGREMIVETGLTGGFDLLKGGILGIGRDERTEQASSRNFSESYAGGRTIRPPLVSDDSYAAYQAGDEDEEEEEGSVCESYIYENMVGRRPERETAITRVDRPSWKEGIAFRTDSFGLLGDLALSRSGCRPCWTPAGLLLHPSDPHTSAKYTLDLCSVHEPEQNTFMESLLEQVEVALRESEVSPDDSGVPFAVCPAGVRALTCHLRASSSLHELDSPLLFHHHTWALISALWGDLPPSECEESYRCEMARRTAVSEWLETIARQLVIREVETLGVTPTSVFSHMTAHDIFSACQLSQKIGDMKLCMVVSQAGSTALVQGLVQRQLTEWRETEADRFIDQSRLKLFQLVAGTLTHQASNQLINCCDNLDWLRAFALHLWYVCWPTNSVTDGLLMYDKAWQSEEWLAAPPLPPYLVETTSPQGGPLSLLYHLLKLFSDKGYPLEPLLDPNTYTDDPLDFSLSWLVMRVLNALGYCHISEHVSSTIHTSFASQLESAGFWHWSVFILLHIKSPACRKKLICDLIDRHIVHENDSSKEEFLRKKLKIPAKWIARPKASKAIMNKKYVEAARNLIEAEDWNQAHDLIVNYIAPKAVIINLTRRPRAKNFNDCENTQPSDGLAESEWLLKRLDGKGVTGWERGGAILLDWIGLTRQLGISDTPNITTPVASTVSSVAARLRFLPDTTPLHRQALEEMCGFLARVVTTSPASESGLDCEQLLSELPMLVGQIPFWNSSAQVHLDSFDIQLPSPSG